MHRRMVAAGWPPPEGATPDECAAALGGAADDWARLADAWGEHFERRLQTIADHTKSMRLRMLGGTQVGYQRMTRRWWAPVRAELNSRSLGDAPLYFVSSNTHSLSNLVTGLAREREDELVAFVEREGAPDLREELARFREGATEGSWENFMYFVARDFFDAGGAELRRRRHEDEVAAGVEHIRSTTALRVPAQVIPLARLRPERIDPRVGAVDAERLTRSEAVIVNTDYPLGLAAYNLLREVAIDSADLRGVYVLGKAATLNADVGDVMISGVIHYASDTPYTQARTLGARGLSYYGMDSTYASSLAILRRILRLEGALVESDRGRELTR